jgi:splicing factor 3B subunit 3
MTSMCILDYDTVGGADKFGNVFVLRAPGHVNDDVDSQIGNRMLWEQGKANGAQNKLDALTHFYLGETVTSLLKTSLVPGGAEVMIASTITGAIYALVPFIAKDDVTFFQHLEMFMRQECVNLAQRDHLSYRSYFQPVKNTIDGDLCERYGTMPYAKQKELADDVDRTPAEIMKKLEETRNIM